MVARVEIRSDCTHVVLALRALRDHGRDLDTVAAISTRWRRWRHGWLLVIGYSPKGQGQVMSGSPYLSA